MRRVEAIKQGDQIIGNRTRAKIVKNKVAPPFKSAEFDIMYGTGISKSGCILDMAVECDVVHKSGSWYTYGEERLGQGREAAKRHLDENPGLRDYIENLVRVEYGMPTIGDFELEDGEGDEDVFAVVEDDATVLPPLAE